MMLRLSLIIVAALSSVAVAGGTWADKIEYRHSTGTSLKVTDPEGFKITVSLPGGDKTDTVPAMFALPDQDSYVKVSVVAPDGTTWSKKVEVRSKQQAELSLQFKTDAGNTATPGRSTVGKFLNEGGSCGSTWARSIKADFVAADGTTALSKQIDPHTYTNLDLASGKYDVRVFVKTNDVWDYLLTTKQELTKDGWELAFGCTRHSTKPAVQFYDHSL
jgi:hypothetical protein